jgi:hypothetical protein
MIWAAWEADYFSSEDWTAQISLIRHDKLGCARIALMQLFRRPALNFAEMTWTILPISMTPYLNLTRRKAYVRRIRHGFQIRNR